MISFLTQSIRMSSAFLFGSTGEIITEKSGHLNLGIPGVMCMGAIGGATGASIYISTLSDISQISPFLAILLPLLCSLLFSAFMGVLYSFLTVSLRANQNITGLALTTFGSGFATFLNTIINKNGFNEVSEIYLHLFGFYDKLGWFGELFFSYGIMVYLAIAVAICTSVILNKTKTGLKLRAVGENPATADAVGINVSRTRYLSTVIGSAIAGLGGLFYLFDMQNGSWPYTGPIESLGWLSIAIVIFSVWKPSISIFSSIVFGVLYRLPNFMSSAALNVKALLGALPYLITIIVLIFTSISGSKNVQPPASLGLNYFREDR